jgi:hypothetical protein
VLTRRLTSDQILAFVGLSGYLSVDESAALWLAPSVAQHRIKWLLVAQKDPKAFSGVLAAVFAAWKRFSTDLFDEDGRERALTAAQRVAANVAPADNDACERICALIDHATKHRVGEADHRREARVLSRFNDTVGWLIAHDADSRDAFVAAARKDAAVVRMLAAEREERRKEVEAQRANEALAEAARRVKAVAERRKTYFTTTEPLDLPTLTSRLAALTDDADRRRLLESQIHARAAAVGKRPQWTKDGVKLTVAELTTQVTTLIAATPAPVLAQWRQWYTAPAPAPAPTPAPMKRRPNKRKQSGGVPAAAASSYSSSAAAAVPSRAGERRRRFACCSANDGDDQPQDCVCCSSCGLWYHAACEGERYQLMQELAWYICNTCDPAGEAVLDAFDRKR